MAVAVGVGAYLAGSIPTGLIAGRLFTGRDVRTVGSGNIGAANVSRLAGMRVAVLVLVLDIVKGVVPVLAARALGLDHVALAAVAGLAVLGHDFPIFLRFRGGKGVATTLGVVLGLAPLAAAVAMAVWLVMLGLTRYSSVGSLVGLWAIPVTMAVIDQPPPYVMLALALYVLALYTHRRNIARLARGQENRVGRRRET